MLPRAKWEEAIKFTSSDLCFLQITHSFVHVCSGHRIGTAEVESALVSHPQCTEAAVVGVDHEVKLHYFDYPGMNHCHCPLDFTSEPEG